MNYLILLYTIKFSISHNISKKLQKYLAKRDELIFHTPKIKLIRS